MSITLPPLPKTNSVLTNSDGIQIRAYGSCELIDYGTAAVEDDRALRVPMSESQCANFVEEWNWGRYLTLQDLIRAVEAHHLIGVKNG